MLKNPKKKERKRSNKSLRRGVEGGRGGGGLGWLEPEVNTKAEEFKLPKHAQ